jgi:hypothetical protein
MDDDTQGQGAVDGAALAKPPLSDRNTMDAGSVVPGDKGNPPSTDALPPVDGAGNVPPDSVPPRISTSSDAAVDRQPTGTPVDARGADSKDSGDPDHPAGLPSSISCGGVACPGVLHAASFCMGTTCASTCEPKATRCYGSGACEKNGWDFESGLDGWETFTSEYSPAREGIVFSTVRAHGGAGAIEARLDVDTTIVPRRNIASFSYNLCGDIGPDWRKEPSMDLTAKTLSAWVFVAPDANAPMVSLICRFYASAGDGNKSFSLIPMQSRVSITPNQWNELNAVLIDPAAVNTKSLGVLCEIGGADQWTGSMFLDDVTLR